MVGASEGLVKRLEEASGPDRALDIAIYEAVVAIPNLGQRVGVNQVSFDPRYSPLLVPHEKWGFICAVSEDAERYTASIDAALTLVPEGLYWFSAYGRMREPEPLGACGLIHPGSNEPFIEAEAATVPLAIVIASLRARAALQTSGAAK